MRRSLPDRRPSPSRGVRLPASTYASAKSTVGFHLGPPLSDPRRIVQAACDRVSGHTVGIVRDCRAVADPLLAGWSMHVARGPRRLAGWHLSYALDGTGVSTDPNASRVAAVAEVVEGYCGTAPLRDDNRYRASPRQLGSRAVAWQHLAWPSADQYGRLSTLRAMTDDHAIDWCPAWSLTRGRAMLVPAAFVIADVSNDVLPEWTSTGLASHVCLTRAVLGGLCEVLERDALATTWYNALATTPLSPAGTPLERLLDRLDREAGVTVRLMVLPTDSPFPVVLALARRHVAPPFAAVGVACHANLAMAASKAVAESIQVMVGLKPGGDGSDLDDDPAARYATPEGAEVLESCLQPTEETVGHCTEPSHRSPSVALNAGVAQLARQGLEVLAAELTTADVAQAGWRVVRVMVPGTV